MHTYIYLKKKVYFLNIAENNINILNHIKLIMVIYITLFFAHYTTYLKYKALIH